jgi:UTP--glucose-1-phosphate uridylyltransferase
MNSTPRITKAIIPVAGWGTRRLPITKAIEKCMLPICNRPVVDYAVEECIDAGITDIFFVVSPDFSQLRSYYNNNVSLEEYLAQRGKHDKLAELQSIPRKANFHYIVQDPSGPYGTAVPLWVARDAVASDENFLVMFGDGFVFQKDGANNVARLITAVQEHDAAGAILGIEMDDNQLSKCSSIKIKQNTNILPMLEAIIEKPAPGAAPSNLANVTYLILNNKVVPFIEQVLQSPNTHGEHYLTDAVTMFANNGNDMIVVPSTGQYLDGGELEGWIKANQIIFAHNATLHAS